MRERVDWLFKPLFTLTEFYDRDRTAFYQAIQRVRGRDVNLTGWLESFVMDLAAQMDEIRLPSHRHRVARTHQLAGR